MKLLNVILMMALTASTGSAIACGDDDDGSVDPTPQLTMECQGLEVQEVSVTTHWNIPACGPTQLGVQLSIAGKLDTYFLRGGWPEEGGSKDAVTVEEAQNEMILRLKNATTVATLQLAQVAGRGTSNHPVYRGNLTYEGAGNLAGQARVECRILPDRLNP